MLVDVQRRYASRGIELAFVSVDEPAEASTVVQTLKQRKIPGPVWIAHPELGYFKQALSPIWQGGMPATFLYDQTGRLRYFWGARALESEVTSVLDGLLANEPIDGLADYRVQR